MRRRVGPILITIIVLAVISMVAFKLISRRKRNQTLSGIYVMGFEKSDFYPSADRCPPSGTRHWLDPETIPALRGAMGASPPHSTMYISFVGDLSPLGSYGHLGQYWREVEVSKILEVKAVEGCP